MWLLQLIYLPPPWGDCKVTPMDSDFFDSYSITACRIDCETRYLVDNCNCRMVHMPGRNPLLLNVESELHQWFSRDKWMCTLQKEGKNLWCEWVLLWLQEMRRTAPQSCTKSVLTQHSVRKSLPPHLVVPWHSCTDLFQTSGFLLPRFPGGERQQFLCVWDAMQHDQIQQRAVLRQDPQQGLC